MPSIYAIEIRPVGWRVNSGLVDPERKARAEEFKQKTTQKCWLFGIQGWWEYYSILQGYELRFSKNLYDRDVKEHFGTTGNKLDCAILGPKDEAFMRRFFGIDRPDFSRYEYYLKFDSN
jgi:hypothetical protein